jgi:hypothetical protein
MPRDESIDSFVLSVIPDDLISDYDKIVSLESPKRTMSDIFDGVQFQKPRTDIFFEYERLFRNKNRILWILSTGNVNAVAFQSRSQIPLKNLPLYEAIPQLDSYLGYLRIKAIEKGNLEEAQRIRKEQEQKDIQRDIQAGISAKERRDSQAIQNRIFRENPELTSMQQGDKLKAELKAIKRIEQIKEPTPTPIDIEISKPALTATTALIIAGAGYLLIKGMKK